MSDASMLLDNLSVSADATKEGILADVSEILGLRYAELGNLEHVDDFSSLRETLTSYEITPLQVHGPTLPESEFDIGNLDPVGRNKALEAHERLMRTCAELGTKYYVVHPGGLMYGRWDEVKKVPVVEFSREFVEKLLDQNVSSVLRLCGVADELGMKVAFENGPFDNPVFLTLADYSATLERIDSGSLGVCIDTGHANMGMVVRPSEIIEKFGNRLCALHLNDNLGTGDLHLPPGKGNIDWKQVVRAVKASNYDGAVSLEVSLRGLELGEYWKEVSEGLDLLRGLIRSS